MTVLHTAASGIAYPGDMVALKRIYDTLCDERGFCHGSPAAEDLAKATMNLFCQGVFDEQEIAETLNLYLDRKASGPNFQPTLAA